MQRVAVAAERADREPERLDGAEQLPLPRRLPEQHVRIAMRAARVVAGTELDGVEPERGDAVEHRLERQVGEEDGEDPELQLASV
jgi:hypothetical protein